MKLKELEQDMLVKIGSGAKSGNGYVYCGRMGDADWDELNDLLLSQLMKTVDNTKMRLEKWDAEVKRRRQVQMSDREIENAENERYKAEDAYRTAKMYLGRFEPLQDREVVETYPSIAENGVTCVLVTGKFEGKYWMINENVKFEINNLNGVVEVYGAALKLICNSLQVEYERLYNDIQDGDVSEKRVFEVWNLERQVLRDAQGLLKDPQSVVRMTRKNAVDNICYITRGTHRTRIRDPKQVECEIMEALGREQDGRPKSKS